MFSMFIIQIVLSILHIQFLLINIVVKLYNIIFWYNSNLFKLYVVN
jgi:hypothetical protein